MRNKRKKIENTMHEINEAGLKMQQNRKKLFLETNKNMKAKKLAIKELSQKISEIEKTIKTLD